MKRLIITTPMNTEFYDEPWKPIPIIIAIEETDGETKLSKTCYIIPPGVKTIKLEMEVQPIHE